MLERRVVFLIAHEDVGNQRTLAGEEAAGDFEGFGVPELGLPRRTSAGVASRLGEEAFLRGKTEVRDCEQRSLLKQRLPCEFQLLLCVRVNVHQTQRAQLHYVADVKGKNEVAA